MRTLFAVSFLLCFTLTHAQKRTYTAARLSVQKIEIDGRMDEPAWKQAEKGGGFIQFEPYEGKPPGQETVFRILYDDNDLYVGIRAYDTEPGKIVKRLSRRDEFDGDWVSLQIDSYYDHRTAFAFTVNAAGVKCDEAVSNNGDTWDASWDPVWFVRTLVDDSGWVAEMKIPFTQLRFGKKENHTWGLQFMRHLFRTQENTIWQFIPRSASGWVFLFGDLQGIQGIRPHRQVEFFPYLVASAESCQKEEGNPFSKERNETFSAGLDGKIGLTNDLTLDLTINPDFGQVEADPSEVNLTAFETFFAEKRPFFIEGKNIFNYQLVPGNGDMSNDNLFYSRRLGRRPQNDPDLNDDEYIDRARNTTILGALKITGKTRKGWSVGLLESMTSEEKGRISRNGEQKPLVMEPLTNYCLGRLQKDFDGGNTIAGGMFTATDRKIVSPDLDFLPAHAYTGGLDFLRTWHNKTWYFAMKSVFSFLSGDTASMVEVQTSPVHYFQRPDAGYLKLDSCRTSLSGYGGTLEVGKVGGGNFTYGVFSNWESPGLELNDMGYLRSADQVTEIAWANYRVFKPVGIFRSASLELNQWEGWKWNGEPNFWGLSLNLNANLKNMWTAGTGLNYDGPSLPASLLFGGPAIIVPGGWGAWYNVMTDSRKKISFTGGGNHYFGDSHYLKNDNIFLNMIVRPSNALMVSAGPTVTMLKNDLQYIDDVATGAGTRYICGTIREKTIGLVVRLNYCLTPGFTVQFYGQPFVVSGKYTDIKRITCPRDKKYSNRFHVFAPGEITCNAANEIYDIDEDRNGSADYSLDNPDFTFFQFRSNLVLRWEYHPGCVLFLVWSQERTGDNGNGNFAYGRGMDDLFHLYPGNIFLAKLSYRLAI